MFGLRVWGVGARVQAPRTQHRQKQRIREKEENEAETARQAADHPRSPPRSLLTLQPHNPNSNPNPKPTLLPSHLFTGLVGLRVRGQRRGRRKLEGMGMWEVAQAMQTVALMAKCARRSSLWRYRERSAGRCGVGGGLMVRHVRLGLGTRQQHRPVRRACTQPANVRPTHRRGKGKGTMAGADSSECGGRGGRGLRSWACWGYCLVMLRDLKVSTGHRRILRIRRMGLRMRSTPHKIRTGKRVCRLPLRLQTV